MADANTKREKKAIPPISRGGNRRNTMEKAAQCIREKGGTRGGRKIRKLGEEITETEGKRERTSCALAKHQKSLALAQRRVCR